MPDFTDPLALFRAVVDALNTEDWSGAAALVHPVCLRRFARQLLEQLAPAVPPRPMTADDYVRFDPQLPREAAEHFAAQARRQADPASRLQEERGCACSLTQAPRCSLLITKRGCAAAWTHSSKSSQRAHVNCIV